MADAQAGDHAAVSAKRVTDAASHIDPTYLDDPTPCPVCGLNTWNGLHRNGHTECVMAEVEP